MISGPSIKAIKSWKTLLCHIVSTPFWRQSLRPTWPHFSSWLCFQLSGLHRCAQTSLSLHPLLFISILGAVLQCKLLESQNFLFTYLCIPRANQQECLVYSKCFINGCCLTIPSTVNGCSNGHHSSGGQECACPSKLERRRMQADILPSPVSFPTDSFSPRRLSHMCHLTPLHLSIC